MTRIVSSPAMVPDHVRPAFIVERYRKPNWRGRERSQHHLILRLAHVPCRNSGGERGELEIGASRSICRNRRRFLPGPVRAYRVTE